MQTVAMSGTILCFGAIAQMRNPSIGLDLWVITDRPFEYSTELVVYILALSIFVLRSKVGIGGVAFSSPYRLLHQIIFFSVHQVPIL